VLFPRGNEKDLPEIPESAKKELKLIPVDTIQDVFALALHLKVPGGSKTDTQRKSVHLHRQS
jgi:ATP-dependent Lon protease